MAEHRDPSHYADEAHRGSQAKSPFQMPWRGLREAGIRIAKHIGEDRVPFVAAGIAFYLMLAFVPVLVAVVSIYALWSDPAEVQKQLEFLTPVVPEDALALIEEQLVRVSTDTGTAGWGSVLGILFALWSGAKALDAIIIGLNIVYREKDSRNFFHRRLISICLTLGSVLLIALSITFAIITPLVLKFIPLGGAVENLIQLIGWPVLLILMILWLQVIYRYAPYRKRASWRWLSWGACVGAISWLAASALFSTYVSNFGSYNESFGTLGAIIILMLWFFMSGFSILLGGEINAELEHQTTRDSTVGSEAPIGQRGAFVADDVVFEPKEPPHEPDSLEKS